MNRLTLILVAGLALTWSLEVDGKPQPTGQDSESLSTITCEGFGIERYSGREKQMDKAEVNLAALLKGEAFLLVNFNDIIMFNLKYDEPYFVTYFALEDQGLIESSYSEFLEVNTLEKYERRYYYEIDIDRKNPPLKISLQKVVVRCDLKKAIEPMSAKKARHKSPKNHFNLTALLTTWLNSSWLSDTRMLTPRTATAGLPNTGLSQAREIVDGAVLVQNAHALKRGQCDPKRKCKNCNKAEYESGDRDEFVGFCKEQEIPDDYCVQMTKPRKTDVFRCTYGSEAPEVMIPVDKDKWKNATDLAKVLLELEGQGHCVDHIYNWWRPEAYNANVDGAPGRHPHATCIDVAFCSTSAAKKAVKKLCKLKKSSKSPVNAVGFYNNSGVHIGLEDLDASWGFNCN